MRIALCDFDEKYVSSLLSYLYGKCGSNNFSTFTTVEDIEASVLNTSYEYSIMGDEFYDVMKAARDSNESMNNYGKIIILSASIENLQNEEAYQVIYKYGPMDGLYRMMTNNDRKATSSKRFAVYSPSHHELTEMYGLSVCQMLRESESVLLIDTMHSPIIRKLIRDGPRASIVDVVYKLENNRAYEIKELIDEYNGVDILPLSLNPMDVAGINRGQWEMLIKYVDSLNYEAKVFVIDDINQGFKSVMEYVDTCILINKRGDYYKESQEEMKEYIRGLGTDVTAIELLMSAHNLKEGCYQLEELLSGNLGHYVRAQNY